MTRSCSTPVSQVAGKSITTIEGLSANGQHPLQVAWIAEEVPQCGYCQSGQIMAAAALLAKTANPSEEQINSFMAANICRCGTYDRIRARSIAWRMAGVRDESPFAARICGRRSCRRSRTGHRILFTASGEGSAGQGVLAERLSSRSLLITK